MNSVNNTMASTFIITCILGGIGLLLYLKKPRKFSNLPAGPKGLPFVGNAFQQDPEIPHITWSKWAVQYGEIFTMWNFGKPTIVCNAFDVIWEMLVTKSTDFAGRPQQYVMPCCSGYGNDVALGDFNPAWVHQKKVFMKGLKMYGEGIKHLEDLMADIIAELIEEMEATKQQPFDPQKFIELTIANTLSLLLLGSRFEQNDADFNELVELAALNRTVFSQSIQSFAYDAFPWLRYLPLSQSKVIDKYVNGFMKGWMPRMVQKAKAKYDRSNCVCVMDAFLKQHEEDIETNVEHPLEECHLVTMGGNFFMGGTVTSTATLYTLFAIVTAEPDIQAKAREEVDKVLKGQRPTLKDKEAMPYMNAMVEEVFRYAPIVPGVPYKAAKDSTLGDLVIPKDAELLANIWFLCHDTTFWEDPYVFKPERFLNSKGEILPVDHPMRKRVLLVFSAGRRACPGEQFTRNRIFLITTSLLQKFIFMPAAEDQLPVYDPRTFKLGVTIMPEPYLLRAVPRQETYTC